MQKQCVGEMLIYIQIPQWEPTSEASQGSPFPRLGSLSGESLCCRGYVQLSQVGQSSVRAILRPHAASCPALPMVFTTGCRAVSALGAPPAPLSSLTLVPSGLFLSYSHSSLWLQLQLHRCFSSLNVLSQRHYGCC